MTKAGRFAAWAGAADAALFVLLLGTLDYASEPAFGPPLSLGALAAAYERMHMPLQAWVPRIQAWAGCQGSLLQSWRTPLAQCIRLALFASNSALFTYLAVWLAWGKRGTAHADAGYVGPLLKAWSMGGRAWAGGGAPLSQGARRALLKDLNTLQQALQALEVDWNGLLRARAQVLGWARHADGVASYWRLLGESTLALALKAGTEPQAEAAAMGRACLRQALLEGPQDIDALAAVLAWDAVEGEEAQALADALAQRVPSHPEPLRWRLRHRLKAGQALELDEALETALRGTLDGQVLLADHLRRHGQQAAALELLAMAVRQRPWDLRWRRMAEDCAPALDEAGQQRLARLPSAGPRPQAGPDWLYGPLEGRGEQSAAMWARRSAAALLLAMGLSQGLWAVLERKPPKLVWTGRWACDALINPAGARLSREALPEVYPTPLAEEACGYTLACEFAMPLAFILKPQGRGEIRLGEDLHMLEWRKTAWGVLLVLDDSSDRLVLRMAQDGLELAVPGQAWHYLFKREEDNILQVVRSSDQAPSGGAEKTVLLPFSALWTGPSAKLVQTSGGTFMDLGERGFVKVAAAGQEIGVYEGLRDEPEPEAAEDPWARPGLAGAWKSVFTVETAYQAPAEAPRACRRCSRRSNCYSASDLIR